MERVRRIEKQIQELGPEELSALRMWFAEFDAEQWERDIARDISEGRLDDLAQQALNDHATGRSRPL